MKFNTSTKVYAHIDCNSFFASCEVYRNPNLKGKCVCVGGEIIVAASYEAKKFGIKTDTPIWEAKRILGNKGVFLFPDLQYYKIISKRFTDFLTTFSDNIEIFSIDEAFVDLSGIDILYKMDYYDFAVYLKNEIKRCVGIPVSIGIANTKIKAKVFSDINKPFGECIAFSDEDVSCVLKTQKATDVPFIGKKMGERLQYIAKSAEDFRCLSFWKVDEIMGKNGTDLWLELNGVDVMSFAGNPIPKSISRTSSFNKKITNDKVFLWSEIVEHFNRSYHILTRYNLELKYIAIYMRDKDFVRYSFDFIFEKHTNIRAELMLKLRDIFNYKVPFENIYRSSGVIMSDFKEFVPKQLSIYDFDNSTFEKNKKLFAAIEGVNKKFGKKAVNVGLI